MINGSSLMQQAARADDLLVMGDKQKWLLEWSQKYTPSPTTVYILTYLYHFKDVLHRSTGLSIHV